jgi:hypothetical protein
MSESINTTWLGVPATACHGIFDDDGDALVDWLPTEKELGAIGGTGQRLAVSDKSWMVFVWHGPVSVDVYVCSSGYVSVRARTPLGLTRTSEASQSMQRGDDIEAAIAMCVMHAQSMARVWEQRDATEVSR